MTWKKLVIAFAAVILIFSSCAINLSASENETTTFEPQAQTFTVWITTDEHIDCNKAHYDTALTDANTIKDWDISICIGDLTNDGATAAHFNMIRYAVDEYSNHMWEDFYCVSANNDDPSNGVFANYIDPFGLHEGTSNVTNSLRPFIVENNSGTYDCCYTITVGNVLFIIWGETIDAAGGMAPNRDWVLGHIQNTTGNMNVVQCMYDTAWSDATYDASVAENNTDGHMFLITGGQKHWMLDCSHYKQNSIRYFDATWNSYVQYSSAIDCTHGGDESHSWFMTFTEGSSDVDLAGYNHSGLEWNTGGCPGWNNTTLTMLLPFEYQADSITPEFIDINGCLNGTEIYTSTPIFNWTNINSTKYHLQVSTTPTFTNLVINISNINKLNYPTEYDENTTRVSFTLPNINALPQYDTYYCRIRGLNK